MVYARGKRLVLGSDVMLGRLRRVARQVGQRGLGNIELLRVNNRELAAFQLPDACLRRIHLLCPDPWPKARHRANRLVTTDFLTRLGRVLEPGGVLHVATDHVPYLEDMARIIGATGCFASAPGAIADIADLRTDFELVWERAGREVEHLAYVSRAGGLQLGGRAAGDRAGHGSRQRR